MSCFLLFDKFLDAALDGLIGFLKTDRAALDHICFWNFAGPIVRDGDDSAVCNGWMSEEEGFELGRCDL